MSELISLSEHTISTFKEFFKKMNEKYEGFLRIGAYGFFVVDQIPAELLGKIRIDAFSESILKEQLFNEIHDFIDKYNEQGHDSVRLQLIKLELDNHENTIEIYRVIVGIESYKDNAIGDPSVSWE